MKGATRAGSRRSPPVRSGSVLRYCTVRLSVRSRSKHKGNTLNARSVDQFASKRKRICYQFAFGSYLYKVSVHRYIAVALNQRLKQVQLTPVCVRTGLDRCCSWLALCGAIFHRRRAWPAWGDT